MFVFTNITYKWPGGAENLAYLLIRQLALSNDQQVKIFGKEDSYLVRRLREEEIGFFFFDMDEEASYLQVDSNDVLVLFSNYYGLKSFRKRGCRVLVWDVLTHSMITWNRLQFLGNMYGADRIRHAFNRLLIGHLQKTNAIVCMDASTRKDLCEYIGKDIDFRIIQVPIMVRDNRYAVRGRNTGVRINITYIGRGDEIWKVSPVKKILCDLEGARHAVSIHIFTSVTDLFERELGSVHDGNVTITYHTGFYGDRLHDALLEVSDINFSMGMSALESASLGIPTILIDPSMGDYPDWYRYRWLFESTDFSLGEFVSHETPLRGGMTLDEVLGSVDDEVFCKSLSELSHRYVGENHSAETVLEKFLQHKSYTGIRQMSRFMPNMWL